MGKVVDFDPKKQGKKGEFCPTLTVRQVHACFEACRTASLIGAVFGPSGSGKSTAISLYRMGNGVASVRLRQSARSLQPGLLALAKAIGAGWQEGNESADVIFNQIASAVSRVELIIVDEAQYAEDPLLEAIRDLHDEARVAVCLVGDLTLEKRLNGQGKNIRLPQLAGRIGPRVLLSGPDSDDLSAIAAHYGVGPAGTRILTKAVAKPGGLHNVRNLISSARILASNAGDKSDELRFGYLKQAAQISGMEVQ